MASRTISTIYKSLVRAVNDLVEEISTRTGENCRYWAFETRMDEDKLPTQTLIGVDGFTFNENKGLWVIRAGVSISSYNDRNGHEEAEMLDIIHELLGHHKKISLRDPDTGNIFSELVVVEFEVMPMSQSEMRNYRTVGIELLRTDNSEA